MTNSNDVFRFIDGPVSYDTGKVFFARLDPLISNTDELLRFLYYLLWFPGYFGFNWNALEDCLRDFSWVSEEKIIIVHDALPNISNDDLKIYLEILRDTVLDWYGYEQHTLKVVFQKKDRERITKILLT
ncbi:barstar family protein [Pantoea sp. ACRSH]|uniref:barstar family protein n=1 Tax=unclassified Pantoea TaxID=2630326 RepID=UPI001EF624A0|nr:MULTISPECIES: barstar family protein [unclassified Pantoea]MCG7366329.1 barstar family protein [Pantoea sp. ACRSH]MCG7396807.1 barstar family protein [Pantoea sp. ACRSC]